MSGFEVIGRWAFALIVLGVSASAVWLFVAGLASSSGWRAWPTLWRGVICLVIGGGFVWPALVKVIQP